MLASLTTLDLGGGNYGGGADFSTDTAVMALGDFLNDASPSFKLLDISH